jgi:hypothetical protein
MDGGGIPNHVHDQRTESGLVEIFKAVRVLGNDKLLDVRVAVHGDEGQAPAELAELEAGSRGKLARKQPKVPECARVNFLDERCGRSLSAQRRLIYTKAGSLAERGLGR